MKLSSKTLAIASTLSLGVAAIVVPLWGSLVVAQAPATTQSCEAIHGSQTAINACEQSLYGKAVLVLTRDLKQVSPLFNANEVAKAQHAWQAYLASQCQVVYSFYSPGTVAPFEKAKCELELTNDRVAELQPLIHVQEHSS